VVVVVLEPLHLVSCCQGRLPPSKEEALVTVRLVLALCQVSHLPSAS